MNDIKRKAKLVLQSGAEFEGFLFGAEVASSGEVVFNTGMVGYPESITDPSYYGQILVLTYPLIGNYGVPSDERDPYGLPRHFESDRIQIRGLITANYHGEYHHWNASRSLGDWLATEGIPGIYGIDTRAVTRYLRDRGTELGRIVVDQQPETDWYDPSTENVVARVSRPAPVTYGSGDVRIAVIDCGVKNNILRCLVKRNATVTAVPWDADLESLEYDGLVLSNGPGDPAKTEDLAERVARRLDDPRPMFGICLGCQIMGMATGARTFKLPFGHRGQNQPVAEGSTGRWAITSQNHGYALDAQTLGSHWDIWYTNGNDQTVEGLRLRGGPHRAVQFHPEAVCGPVDTGYLFDIFLEDVRRAKR